MKILKTQIKDLKIIKSYNYSDKRGYLRETYRKNIVSKTNFPFDIVTYSKKNVLRGLHLQTKKSQAKIITVVYGKIFDVVVDLRKKSKTFGKHFSITFSNQDNFSLYVPENFAHGFVCLSEKCVIHYKMSNYRLANFEQTIYWKDNFLDIKWPIKNPIISKKDSLNTLSFEEYCSSYVQNNHSKKK